MLHSWVYVGKQTKDRSVCIRQAICTTWWSICMLLLLSDVILSLLNFKLQAFFRFPSSSRHYCRSIFICNTWYRNETWCYASGLSEGTGQGCWGQLASFSNKGRGGRREGRKIMCHSEETKLHTFSQTPQTSLQVKFNNLLPISSWVYLYTSYIHVRLSVELSLGCVLQYSKQSDNVVPIKMYWGQVLFEVFTLEACTARHWSSFMCRLLFVSDYVRNTRSSDMGIDHNIDILHRH